MNNINDFINYSDGMLFIFGYTVCLILIGAFCWGAFKDHEPQHPYDKQDFLNAIDDWQGKDDLMNKGDKDEH